LRLVSNGSEINARAHKKPMWGEIGVPVSFFVGDSGEKFGEAIERLGEPGDVDGYLPVVKIRFRTATGAAIEEKACAAVPEKYSSLGTAFVRFLQPDKNAKSCKIEAQIGADETVKANQRAVVNAKGEALVAFKDGWKWDGKKHALVAELSAKHPIDLA